ncbi:hypothetical protein AOLI_G00005640 [Acnodon oligacanthus]
MFVFFAAALNIDLEAAPSIPPPRSKPIKRQHRQTAPPSSKPMRSRNHGVALVFKISSGSASDYPGCLGDINPLTTRTRRTLWRNARWVLWYLEGTSAQRRNRLLPRQRCIWGGSRSESKPWPPRSNTHTFQ